MGQRKIYTLIKTPCGREKYEILASKKGVFAFIRLCWFVFFAALEDYSLPIPKDQEDSTS